MKVVAVKGLYGGAGTTTVTANLASALRRRQHPVVAVDLCATNMLRLHFGMPVNDRRGLFKAGELVDDLANAAFETEQGLIYLPYGDVSEQPERTDIEQLLQRLYDLLAKFSSEQTLIVLIDMPNAEPQMLSWLAAHTDIMLHVLSPDPRVYPALHYFSMKQWPLIQAEQLQHYFVLNQCAPQLELNRDIIDLLRYELAPELLLPTYIQRDQHLPEAFATQQAAIDFTLGAQANVDFVAIAEWLELRLLEAK